MIKSLPNEKWKKIPPIKGLKNQYAVSNMGRLASFTDKVENGTLLKGSYIKKYQTLNYRQLIKGEYKHSKIFIHRIVAELFIANKDKKKDYVIHLDHNLKNNKASNLKWVTYEGMVTHKKSNPAIIASQKRLTEFNKGRDGSKLTISKVKQIKAKINDPKRKLPYKKIAEQFNISEMQLYRIKSGENWSYIKIKK